MLSLLNTTFTNAVRKGFTLVGSLLSKLKARSTYFENKNCTKATLEDLDDVNLLEKASIITTPTAYSDGKLHSVKPKGGENLLLQSNQFDTAWSVSADLNLTSGQSGYDNTNDAWLLKKAAVGKKSCQQFLSLPSSKYIYSVYFKAESTNWVQLWAYNGSVSSNAFFDLENGVVGTTSGPNLNNATIKSVGNGWYRCVITYISETTILRIYPAYSDNNTIDGADSGIYIQDAQLERGFEANTYIETTTTAIKNADFDFQRGSAATRVNSQGLIENVQILSGNLVQNGDFSEIGSEEVTNGGFDTDSDWTLGNGSYISEGSLILPNTGTAIQTGIPTNKMVRLDVQGSGNITYRLSTGVSFQQISLPQTIYLTTGSSGGRVQFSNTSGSEVTIDNVSVKEVGQNWTFGTGWSMGDGKAVFDGFSNISLAQDGIVANNKKYKLTYTILDYVQGGVKWRFGLSSNLTPVRTANGTYVEEIIATGSDFRAITDGSTKLSIDNISVIEITDDTDLPRIDYTDGCGSLLLEPQSTNLITKSELFSGWNKTAISVFSNNIASPSGEINATRIVESSTNSVHSLSLGGVITGNQYTISVFAKAKERSIISFGGLGLYSNNEFVQYDLINGTATNTGTTNNASVSIKNYGNGWYRCIATYTATGSSGLLITMLDQLYSGNSASGSGQPYQGDGTSGVYIWGAQLENQSFPTSYIPTNGSSATRLADVCNNAGSSDLINSTEGVLYAEISALANDGTERNLSLSDGTSNNRISWWFNATDNLLAVAVYSSSNLQYFTNLSVGIATNSNKIAFKYKQNNFSLFINGIEVATDTSGITPIGLSKLSFNRGDNLLPFYGKVKSVAVFPYLTNDELEGLTGEGYDTFNALALANNYTII